MCWIDTDDEQGLILYNLVAIEKIYLKQQTNVDTDNQTQLGIQKPICTIRLYNIRCSIVLKVKDFNSWTVPE